jgi:hypothetical protein
VRPEVVAAERSKEVRDAARSWRRAGFVAEETLSRITALYPDDRQRFGPGFRALAFVFAVIASLAMVGLSFSLLDFEQSKDEMSLLIVWAVILAGLTELQRGPWRRASAGAEGATALLSVLLASVWVLAFDHSSQSLSMIRFMASSCLVCTLAAWRWGDLLFFLGAGVCGFALLAQTDHGRLFWILASLLLIPVCLKAARNPRRAPSHRKGAVVLGAVAILALYAAIHIWSWDQRLIEDMGEFSTPGRPPSSLLRTLSMLATGLLPTGFLIAGWRRREPLLLYSGLLLIGASIATIRLYRPVMPLSMALIVIGLVCLGLALGVRRWLRSGDKGERDGFTADPLFDHANRTDAIRSVMAMASFTPSAQTIPTRNAFEGGGGNFGGGGATGNF